MGAAAAWEPQRARRRTLPLASGVACQLAAVVDAGGCSTTWHAPCRHASSRLCFPRPQRADYSEQSGDEDPDGPAPLAAAAPRAPGGPGVPARAARRGGRRPAAPAEMAAAAAAPAAGLHMEQPAPAGASYAYESDGGSELSSVQLTLDEAAAERQRGELINRLVKEAAGLRRL